MYRYAAISRASSWVTPMSGVGLCREPRCGRPRSRTAESAQGRGRHSCYAFAISASMRRADNRPARRSSPAAGAARNAKRSTASRSLSVTYPLAPRGIGERVAQKQVAAAAPHVDQGPPSRIARRERLAHDQAEPTVANVAAGNLRRERQELLVDEALRVKVAQQSRPALDEDQLAAASPDTPRRGWRSPESRSRCDESRGSRPNRAHFACVSVSHPRVVVTINAGTLPDANTGKRRSIRRCR